MSDQLEVFSEYGNRFADKYGEKLGELAGPGAVIMGLMAEVLKCDCGGMRVPFDCPDTGESRIYCPKCHGEWRDTTNRGPEQPNLFEGA